jgi:hypothetical protein
MSSHDHSEGQLVEQPAIGLFAARGWQTQQKCAAVFEHVFERYPERNMGVYA